MDPVAMARSAVDIMAAMKKQLEDAMKTFQEAATLKDLIDRFEVTIMMIPSKGAPPGEAPPTEESVAKSKASSVASSRRSSQASVVSRSRNASNASLASKGSVPKKKTSKLVNTLGAIAEEGEEVAEAAEALAEELAAVVDPALEGELATVFAAAKPSGMSLFNFDDSGRPKFNEGPPPADTLRKMKEEKDANGYRVYSDLDVMFCGMAFIISGALSVVQKACDTVKELDKLGTPNCTWVVQPWKTAEVLEFRDQLTGHGENLFKATQALQAAIGVASYAVQLEQLEQALDATSPILYRDLKLLWRKKIGVDKTKTYMYEFCDAMLSEFEDRIADLRKERAAEANLTVYTEKIGRSNCDPEIALTRFLDDIFNQKKDEWLSVYEMCSALYALKLPITRNAVDYTFKILMTREKAFQDSIHFEIITKLMGRPINGLEVERDGVPDKGCTSVDDNMVFVMPFRRVPIVCELPLMGEDFYEYDSLVLLKHEKDPRVILTETEKYNKKKGLVGEKRKIPEFVLSVVDSSRLYVKRGMNKIMYGDDESMWNARNVFKMEVVEDFYGKKIKTVKPVPPPYFRNETGQTMFTNWEYDEAEIDDDTDEEDEDSEGAGRDDGNEGVDDDDIEIDPFPIVRILWIPYVLKVGVYSPRYCCDTYVESDDGKTNARIMAKAAKSFYRGTHRPSEGEETGEYHRDGFYNEDKSEVCWHSLGPTIKVRDVNTVVWGEEVGLTPEQEALLDDEDSDDGKAEGRDEVRPECWRPVSSKFYPYQPDPAKNIKTPRTVGVYVNVERAKKPKPTDGSSTAAATSAITAPPRPKLGLFRKPAKQVDPKSGKEVFDDIKNPHFVMNINASEPLHVLPLGDHKKLSGLDGAHRLPDGQYFIGFLGINPAGEEVLDTTKPFVRLFIDKEFHEEEEEPEEEAPANDGYGEFEDEHEFEDETTDESAEESDEAPYCRKGHKMVISTYAKGLYKMGWKCGTCNDFKAAGLKRWFCLHCTSTSHEESPSDYCFDCPPPPYGPAEDGAPLCGSCELRTVHSCFDKGGYTLGWTCKSCGEFKNGYRWNCIRCNNDYCMDPEPSTDAADTAAAASERDEDAEDTPESCSCLPPFVDIPTDDTATPDVEAPYCTSGHKMLRSAYEKGKYASGRFDCLKCGERFNCCDERYFCIHCAEDYCFECCDLEKDDRPDNEPNHVSTPYCRSCESYTILSAYADGIYKYGWRCKTCNKKKTGARYFCINCKEDYCADAEDGTPSPCRPGEPVDIPYDESAQADDTAPNCSAGHKMCRSTYAKGEYASGSWACKLCLTSKTGERYFCIHCSEDFCYSCPAPENSSSDLDEAPQCTVCDRKTVVSSYAKGSYKYGWKCTNCDREKQGERWLCIRHKVDICFSCVSCSKPSDEDGAQA